MNPTNSGISLLLLASFTVFCVGQLDLVLLNNRILEHQASGKCLTVAEDYKLFLDKCNFELEDPTIAGVFSVVRHNIGGHLMRWRTGPIPGAIEGCLQALKPKKALVVADEEEDEDEADDVVKAGTGRGELRFVSCDTRDQTLNWEFERNDTYKYLLKKFPDGPCVASNGGSSAADVYTLPCNGADEKQIWRVCEDVDAVKCDP